MLSVGVWSPNVNAALIAVDEITTNNSIIENRAHVQAFFERDDVQAQLKSRGVSKDAAQARVNAMTDDEIASINGRIDSLPAAGDAGSVGLIAYLGLLMLVSLSFMMLLYFAFDYSLGSQ